MVNIDAYAIFIYVTSKIITFTISQEGIHKFCIAICINHLQIIKDNTILRIRAGSTFGVWTLIN